MYDDFGANQPADTPIEFDKLLGSDSIFSHVINYLYTDELSEEAKQNQNIAFFFDLCIQANFFMLERLKDLVQVQLTTLLTKNNVLSVLPVAIELKATLVQRHCDYLICLNYEELEGTLDKETKARCSQQLIDHRWPTKDDIEKWETLQKALNSDKDPEKCTVQ